MRRALLTVPLLLAACNDGDSPPPAPPAPPVQITSANLQEVAEATMAAAIGLADVVRIQADLVAPGPDPLALTLQPDTSLPVVTTETRQGPEGGEVLFTWDDADDDQEVSTGDTFLSTFSDFGRFGLVLNGTMTVEQTDVSGPPLSGETWTVRGRLLFVNLAVTRGATTEILNGSLSFVRERRPSTTILTCVLDQGFETGGMSLQPGNTLGYNEYPFSYEFAYFAKGSALDDTIPGLFVFDGVVPFSGLVLLPSPWGGRLELYGADDALVTVRIPDFGLQVLIEGDFDGDGVVDETITTTWPVF